MEETKDRKMFFLRLILTVNAIGWGISILGAVVPWHGLTAFLRSFGAGKIPADPILEYSLRMAAGAFFMLGVIYGLAAWNPRKYWALIPFLGGLGIVEATILLAHGLLLQLNPWQFCGDIVFCGLTGIWTLKLYKSLNHPSEQENKTQAH